jgi:hypothetical protein
MLHKAKVAVCSEINKKHINAVWTECTVFNINPGGKRSNQQALNG